MASHINRVVLTGNLTRDPELRALPSGGSVCNLRLACNGRKKGQGGEWEDKPNYFDVAVWGALGESCARFLGKGRPIAIDGRLEWREWEDRDGNKRQTVDITADNVQFLHSAPEGGYGNGAPASTPAPDVPIDLSHMQEVPAQQAVPVAPTKADDDIPFLWEPVESYDDTKGHASRW